jgi:large subunit ribosomal protein L28
MGAVNFLKRTIIGMGQYAMAACENCGKSAMVGNNVSHSKHRSKRRFYPNIQRVTVAEGTKMVKKYMCTKCIKTLHKV